jgi:uncharacterized protein YndB with AHSA1/START domain
MAHTAATGRTISAPPDRVWRALTTDELAAWFWPPSFATQTAFDARPGGRYRIASAAVGMAASGEVMALEAPERLAMTWRWDGEDLETHVELTLHEDPAGTAIRVVHDGFPTAEAAAEHVQGWSDCLDRLPRFLEEWS